MPFWLCFFIATTFLMLGIGLGGRWTDNIWIDKAKSGFRRECRGRLYRVRLDTDEPEFDHGDHGDRP